jgi:metal-responsive CopG/Arc/MetJ family transcriptional regulator
MYVPAHVYSDTCLNQARRRNIVDMSTETVVALPEDLKAALDRRAPNPPQRDELIAAALRAYFAWPRPGEDSSDLAVINAHSDELNAEAEDALSYQVPL